MGGLLGALPDPSVIPSSFESTELSRQYSSCQGFENAEQYPLLGSVLVHTFTHPFTKVTILISVYYVPSNILPGGNITINYMWPVLLNWGDSVDIWQ